MRQVFIGVTLVVAGIARVHRGASHGMLALLARDWRELGAAEAPTRSPARIPDELGRTAWPCRSPEHRRGGGEASAAHRSCGLRRDAAPIAPLKWLTEKEKQVTSV